MNIIANIEAEQSVLGGLLTDNEAYDRLGQIEASHFFRADHQAIFEIIRKLLETGAGADVITVHDKLRADYPDYADFPYLNSIANSTPSTANIAKYASIVREKSQRRQLVQSALEVSDRATNDLASDAASLIDALQGELERLSESRPENEPVRVSDDLVNYVDELTRREEGAGPQAIPTGFADLDKKMNGGIRRGELVIVAARPKMGKSAFAFNVAVHAAKEHSVLVCSMEMPRYQIHDRNVAMVGKINMSYLIDPATMPADDWSRVTYAVSQLEQMNLFLDDQGALRLMDVRAKARAIKRKHGLDLLVIDYLQLMTGEGDNRNNQIEQITRGLKALAMEMKIGIVLLSQLNRDLERRPDKRPMPADLRDSGAIEQDCDMALFLYRDEVYNPNSDDKGICEVNMALSRQGDPGVVGLSFIGSQARFEDLAKGVYFNQFKPKKKFSGLKD